MESNSETLKGAQTKKNDVDDDLRGEKPVAQEVW